jgi:DNA-binding NtrC family response regulator
MNESAPVVYVVDDDASFLPAMSRLLRAAGYVVRTFSRAEEFLSVGRYAWLRDRGLQMPGLSGLDLQQALTRAGHMLQSSFLPGTAISRQPCTRCGGVQKTFSQARAKEDLLETSSAHLTGRQHAPSAPERVARPLQYPRTARREVRSVSCKAG